MNSVRRAVTLALVTVAAACSDPTSPKPKEPDPFDNVPYQAVACPNIQSATASAVPLDRVPLGSVPASFASTLHAYVDVEGDTVAGYGVIDRDASGNVTLIAPVHPSGSPNGGVARLWVTDGTRACAPFSFTVQPLPPAPGELAGIVERVAELIDSMAAELGTTVDAIVSTPLDALPAELVPIALVKHLLDDPDNNRSLAAIAAGTSPLSAAEVRLDLLEPILARSGLRAALGTSADAPAARSGSISVAPGTERLPVQLSQANLASCAVSQEDLHDCMRAAQSALFRINGATGQVLEEVGTLVSAAGLVPGLGNAATILGFLGWLAALADAMQAHLFPSSFTGMRLEAEPLEWAEDQNGIGSWVATVTATSTDWEFTAEMVSLFGQLASLVSLGAVDLDGPLLEVLGGGTAADLVSFIGTLLSNNWDDNWTESDLTTIPARTFGPVSLMGEDWSEAEFVLGTALELGPDHHSYRPVDQGTATLVVRNHRDKFVGTVSASTPITVHPITIQVSPGDEVFAQPDESIELVFTIGPLANEPSNATTRISRITTIQGSFTEREPEFDHSDEIGSYYSVLVVYQAPPADELDPTQPDLLTLQHFGTGSLLESGRIPLLTTTVRFADLNVTADKDCVEPGEPVRFRAYLGGEVVDSGIQWTSDVGQIDATGLFQTTESGEATITATWAGPPELTASASVQVGGCSCSVSFNLGGSHYVATNGFASFRRNANGTGIIGFGWTADSPAGLGDAGFGTGFDDTMTAPVGASSERPLLLQGIADGGTTIYNNIETGDEMPYLLVNTLIDVNENGTEIRGTASGRVYIVTDQGAPSASITLVFRITDDPEVANPNPTTIRCLLPDG